MEGKQEPMDVKDLKLHEPDREAMRQAAERWRGVCKPLGSLGELEELVIRLAGMTGSADVRIDRRCVLVACADNGVVAEGVTQADSAVTASVAAEIAEGKSNINVMGRAAGVDTYGVDVGMRTDVRHEKLLVQKTAHGTSNIAEGAAMAAEDAVSAVRTGIALVARMKASGYQIVLTGEMGIGNTTTASALAAVLLSKPVREVTGRGAGLTSQGLLHKIEVIEKAISVNHADAERDDALTLLAKLGGYDIAAMTGMFLGGGISRVPVVIDGFISSVAALLAVQIHPLSREYMLASHMTEEPAGAAVMETLGLRPVIRAGMRLGEGTGAVCLLPLLDIALAEYRGAHRFAQTDITQYEELV